jgi:hypothetical protein
MKVTSHLPYIFVINPTYGEARNGMTIVRIRLAMARFALIHQDW